jgi:hypothetical protein
MVLLKRVKIKILQPEAKVSQWMVSLKACNFSAMDDKSKQIRNLYLIVGAQKKHL